MVGLIGSRYEGLKKAVLGFGYQVERVCFDGAME